MINKIKTFVSGRNRHKKFKEVLKYIMPGYTIVDIGVDSSLGIYTNYFERWFKDKNHLTCLGLYGEYSGFMREFPNVNLIQFDGFKFPKFENKFDIAFSNAVIEHVGDYQKQLFWLKEIKQFANTLIITTPDRLCPFEAHTNTFFIHWLPKWISNSIYKIIKIKERCYKNLWLLTLREFKGLLNEAGFTNIKVLKNKVLFITIDFLLVANSE